MDAETFDQKKYVDFFAQLQQAYKNVFNRMNDEYDSTLIHGIDQYVLNESEPFYDDESGSFSLDVPENPYGRLDGSGVVVEQERFQTVLDTYVEELEAELERTFG
ncbi:MAG: DUF5783 family protein [Natronomonas sp.]|uniref:DUF5783 family protein n=1 Tax=Natronomonas sp. TaxID=2184060 RepID=UPI00286FCE66|nr:DUF5783 family protein [Natronomonas sp.]MDR9430221.1 DUF5783 family protein [Natronomonas sp.]